MDVGGMLGPPLGDDPLKGFRRGDIPSLLDGLGPDPGLMPLDRGPGAPFGGSFGPPPVPPEPLGPPEPRPMFGEPFGREPGRGGDERRFEPFGLDGPAGVVQREEYPGPNASNGASARGGPMPAPPSDGASKKKDPTDLEIIVLNKLQT